MKKARLIGTIAILLGAGLLHGTLGAQIYDAGTLLRLGNENWNRNCVVSAMNYYALLQRFPGWLKGNAEAEARSRVDRCRRGYRGTAGVDGKADGNNNPIPRPPDPPLQGVIDARMLHVEGFVVRDQADAATPRVRACRAYAETAVAQSRLLASRECAALRPYKESSYEFHYNWCTQRGTPEAAQAYANDRARALNSCQLRW